MYQGTSISVYIPKIYACYIAVRALFSIYIIPQFSAFVKLSKRLQLTYIVTRRLKTTGPMVRTGFPPVFLGVFDWLGGWDSNPHTTEQTRRLWDF